MQSRQGFHVLLYLHFGFLAHVFWLANIYFRHLYSPRANPIRLFPPLLDPFIDMVLSSSTNSSICLNITSSWNWNCRSDFEALSHILREIGCFSAFISIPIFQFAFKIPSTGFRLSPVTLLCHLQSSNSLWCIHFNRSCLEIDYCSCHCDL